MLINDFNTDKKVLIIAEIGNNHEGCFKTAVKMVKAAAKSGVDAVKFQTFKTKYYVHSSQKERSNRLKRFELTHEEFRRLSKIAREENLLFVSTPFDLESAYFLGQICDAIKVSSSDNTFYPLLQAIEKINLPVLASTGLASIKKIRKLAEYFSLDRLALLHCVSSYPTFPESVNLSYISKLKKEISCTIGYSDHTLGIEAAVLSVACGARIVEKHFTLDKNFSDFHDHRLSADPNEIKELVRRIRIAEKMLGNNNDIQNCEKDNIIPLRRSIVAKHNLSQGAFLTMNDITWVRPGGNLEPGEEHLILGKKLNRPIKYHEPLLIGYFEK